MTDRKETAPAATEAAQRKTKRLKSSTSYLLAEWLAVLAACICILALSWWMAR